MGFPGYSDGKESACNAGDLGLIPGSGRPPWRRIWQPTPILLPAESHGQKSLAGYIQFTPSQSQTQFVFQEGYINCWHSFELWHTSMSVTLMNETKCSWIQDSLVTAFPLKTSAHLLTFDVIHSYHLSHSFQTLLFLPLSSQDTVKCVFHSHCFTSV